MKIDGRQIKKQREQKGLTQKELANLTNLNTRTIQRIENEHANARAFTLNRIAEVLDLSIEDLDTKLEPKTVVGNIIKIVSLVLVNFGIVFVFGFLTMDSNANLNSMFGAVVLSGVLPFLIYHYTIHLSKEERLLKFGLGLWLYMLIFFILHGPVVIFGRGLIYPVIFFNVVLYGLGKKVEKK